MVVLARGLNFVPTKRKLDYVDFIAKVELAWKGAWRKAVTSHKTFERLLWQNAGIRVSQCRPQGGVAYGLRRILSFTVNQFISCISFNIVTVCETWCGPTEQFFALALSTSGSRVNSLFWKDQRMSDERMKKLILFLLALISYWNALFGEFVFDDIEAVVKNDDVHWTFLKKSTVPKQRFWQFLFNDFWGMPMCSIQSHKSWRPLTVLSFRLNYAFGELRPIHYHLGNVLLHGIVTMMSLDFYVAMQPLGQEEVLANLPFWSSLLFACHPIHVDAVASIVGRAEIISALLYMCSFFEYCKALKRGSCWKNYHLFMCLILTFMALAAKEQGVMAIFFCIAYDVLVYSWNSLTCVWQKRVSVRKCIKKSLSSDDVAASLATAAFKRMGTMLTWFLLLSIFRLHLMSWTLPRFSTGDTQVLPMYNFVFKTINQVYIYVLNLWLLVCPSFLCFDYSMGCIEPIQSIKDFRLWTVLLIACTFAVLACWKRRKWTIKGGVDDRHLLLGLSCVIIPFVPASNLFFTVGFVVAERTLYLPSLGFCWIVAYFILQMQSAERFHVLKQCCSGFFYFTLMVFVCRCVLRNNEWRNEWTLFKSGLLVCPNNAKVHYNLGKLYADAGKREDALKYYKKAIALKEKYEFALNNLALILLSSDRLANAEELLQRAVAANHQFGTAWMNLGTVQAALHKYREAEKSYKVAIHYKADCADCFYNMGNMYNSRNDTRRALMSWMKAVQMNQHHAAAWTNLIICARNARMTQRALKIGLLALQFLPNHDGIHFSIGICYAELGNHHRSEIHFEHAVKRNPSVRKYRTAHSYMQRLRRTWQRKSGIII
uniref:dolichyl-phosphate-mannose--protein mannosyltransferase n=1 Tax=Trichuris muris TaxID=70415 RepID=A0A5S6R087_TRIMR